MFGMCRSSRTRSGRTSSSTSPTLRASVSVTTRSMPCCTRSERSRRTLPRLSSTTSTTIVEKRSRVLANIDAHPDPVENGQDVAQVQRLGEVLLRAELDQPAGLPGRGVRRQDQNRGIAGGWVGLEPADDVHPRAL